MKQLLILPILLLPFFVENPAYADRGVVVKRYSGCDYFVADGPRGLYVLEWYGGYGPYEGDRIVGDIGSYGFENVYYPDRDREGRVYVEDYLESVDGASDEIRDHCY